MSSTGSCAVGEHELRLVHVPHQRLQCTACPFGIDLDAPPPTPPGQLARRRFDHEEAVRRYLAGERVKELAAAYGVTDYAVYRVTKQATVPGWREKENAYHREQGRRTKRTPCKGGCGKLVWTHQPWRSGYCPRCNGLRRSTSIRPDTLQCSHCKKWLPDDDFPRATKNVGRRGRHSTCRACSTKVRQEYRVKRRIPCARCGKPRTHPKDGGRGYATTGLCRQCWEESRAA